MKTKPYPQFWIEGRYARSLRKLLKLSDKPGEMAEATRLDDASILLGEGQRVLKIQAPPYLLNLCREDAWLGGGALTAWLGGYPASDYDFF